MYASSLTPTYSMHLQTYQKKTSYDAHFHSYLPPSLNARAQVAIAVSQETQSQFVGDAEEIKEMVKDAHLLLLAKPLPDNILIHVENSIELQNAYSFFNGIWQEGIQGFCVNRKEGIKHVFAKQASLGKVLLTIGHELGHLQSGSLFGVEEEAKAYAFSVAWMETIRKHNIAALQDALVYEDPAENGLHNVAHAYVKEQIQQGKAALDVFKELLEGKRIDVWKYD